MKYILILTTLLLSSNIIAQNKRDYVWPMDHGFELNFNEVPLMIKEKMLIDSFALTSDNGSICDEDGNLLLFSNGCSISNGNYEQIINGDSINAGAYLYEFLDGNCRQGYISGLQGPIFLPDPANEQGYYMIHQTKELDWVNKPTFYMDGLKYTYIDFSEFGKGAVTEKNKWYFEGRIMPGYQQAIQHSNKKDWWIIQPDDYDGLYYTLF